MDVWAAHSLDDAVAWLFEDAGYVDSYLLYS